MNIYKVTIIYRDDGVASHNVSQIKARDQEQAARMAKQAAEDLDGHVVAIEVLNPPKKVVIEVSGGVAGITHCPEGVEVEIIDHDFKGE